MFRIGQKHNKTSAQVTLRYLIQRGISVIPKTVNKDRMRQNFEVFDFELNDNDMLEMNILSRNNLRMVNPDFAPEWDK